MFSLLKRVNGLKLHTFKLQGMVCIILDFVSTDVPFNFLSHQYMSDSDRQLGERNVAVLCAGLCCHPSDQCCLGFQVPLLQVIVPCVLPPHPICLQAALPGVAVHEHYPQVETGQVQRVRMSRVTEGQHPVQPKAEDSRETEMRKSSLLSFEMLAEQT